jgi:ATP-binding cassette, subfamily B, bacterial HlyB/CyaB
MMLKNVFSWFRGADARRVELSAADAAWVVGGLATLARRPAPRLAFGENTSVSSLAPAVADVGFKLEPATLRELTDEANVQASSRWFVFLELEGAVRPAAVLKIDGNDLTLVSPGSSSSFSRSLDQLSRESLAVVHFTPDFPTDEEGLERFGWCWFARAFFARKKVIRDVGVASLVISVVGLAFPLATQAIVDKVITNQATSTLVALGIGIGLMAMFSGVMGWLRQKLLLRLSNVVDADLSQRVMLHLLQLPLPYFTRRPTGTLINRLHGIERIREFVASAFLLGALELPFMLVFLALMVSYSLALSGVVLGFLALMMLFSFVAGPVLRARANEAMRLGAKVQGYVTEHVAAVETVKCLQLEPHVSRQFRAMNEAQLQSMLKLREFGNGYGSFMQTAEQLMNASILCLGAYLAMTTTDLTIGMLVAFQMFAQRVAQPLLKLSGMWQELQQVRVSASMLGEVVNQPIERYSSHLSSSGPASGAVSVEGLSFCYGEGQPTLFNGLSLELKPGTVTLLTGESGSGKSTLAKVLLGLYSGYDGTIRIDGRDIRSMSVNEVRGAFGVVPQESLLFSGTIIENLMSVATDATMERAILACKMAGIHSTIENMPSGYQSTIGERGAGLSGGQRQRLAVARALLKRPKVLIFDEAVASLDDESAAHIAHSVNGLRGKVTMLFITHKIPAALQVDSRIQLKTSVGTCGSVPGQAVGQAPQ